MPRKPGNPEPALTPEQLQEVERLGALQFRPAEVALVLGISGEWPEQGPCWTSYHRGRLRAEAEVRAAIHKAALQGSAPAQKQFGELATANRPRGR
ncbi:MAG: hypothetical protein RBU30_14870 [Polyangia bacterium]|jgi:hypothetical protein|nr:hypothetical protein [Polyangia bacterium]